MSMKTTIQFLSLAAIALALSNCAQPAGPSTRQGALIGAATGAAAGGIIGHQSGRGLEGAAIGAALGGTTGAVIGNSRE
jgi:uncharacterized protein YcfJ